MILRGGRKVGKTYVLKEFGENNYDNVAYFNSDHNDELSELFLNAKDPKGIIEQLSLANGKKINPRTTLIIFDEIQECPNALNYLLDESPNYYTFDRHEIDFLIQRNNEIIPIEVKSDKSNNHNSLTKYNTKSDNKISFIFSLNNVSKDGKIVNIPLYFIEYIDNLNLD